MESPRLILTAEESSDNVPEGRAFMVDNGGAPECPAATALLLAEVPLLPRTLLTTLLKLSLILNEPFLVKVTAFRT